MHEIWKYMKRFALNCFVLIAVVCTASAAATPAAFIKAHCIECHDADTKKGGLDLVALQPNWSTPKSFAIWEKLFDRLAKGEMPPKKSTQPAPEERGAFLKSLGTELHTASAARQQAAGRVVVRRMNRTEYEHTVHDLLGITAPLKDLLPEDNGAAGFDKVSSALETSATHLVRYQEAADRALAAALPAWPLTNAVRRWTGRQFLDSRPKPNREGTAPFVRFEGDTIVLCARLYKHGSVTTPPTPAPGRYRIRASVRAVNTDGKSIPMLVGKISSDRFAHEKLQHVLDHFDAPADRARVVEVEAALPAGEQVYLEGLDLTFFQDLKKQRNGEPVGDDFKGPGLAVDWIELEGPLDAGVGYARLFGDLPQVPSRYLDDTLAGKPVRDDWKKWSVPGEYSKYPLSPVSREPKADAERLLRAFLPRAFRRPVSEDTVAYFVRFVHEQLDQGERFGEAMRAGYKAALCSPHFLLYVEKPGRLDDFAVAARLARLLWNSLPDDELTALAAKGELLKPANLRAQTERLLKDPKAQRFITGFTGQWLDLRKFQDMKPDALYLEYDDLLAWSMPLETTKFFAEVLAHDLPTSAFVHSDWTFLNARLAKHYGLPGVLGLELCRVNLPSGSHRGGLITHASLLKLTTNATYTSPVKRGAWMLERIIGKPPPPPPADVAAIEPDIRGATTLREQLDKHKNVAVCASCHVHIDPPGFALENFDVVGGWRERYRVKQPPPKGGDYAELANYPGKKVWLARPVEPAGETAAGQAFANIDDYKRLLLRDPDQLTRNLAQKLLTYATGADIQFADRAVVEPIVTDVRQQHHGFRALVHAVVQSPVFLSK
ncbi:MAG: DUF1592 domain-containing protein [Proteobacteria bacterium]|nr:DUF1592 domain-containing protein [Pseudomonadota bacterium]